MYGELLQTKFTYDEESETVTQMCFEKISKACRDKDETRKCQTTGKDCFTFEDFKQAREDNPELFEWIDEPERYVEEFMKQNATKEKMSQVKFDDFESYHMNVMSSIQTIIDAINNEFTDNEFDRESKIRNSLQSLSKSS